MTTHEMAKLLLAGPDVPVLMSVSAWEGYVSPLRGNFEPEFYQPPVPPEDAGTICDEDDEGAIEAVILSPESWG